MQDDYWCVFYDDGSTFDSYDGDPDDVPTLGVQVVLTPKRKDLRELGPLAQWAWYWWHTEDRLWYGGTRADLDDFLLHKRKTVGVIVRGRTIDSGDYDRIYSEALAMRDRMKAGCGSDSRFVRRNRTFGEGGPLANDA